MNLLRSSLRVQLTALCSLLTLLAFVWTGVDSYRQEQNTLYENTTGRLRTLANMVAVNVSSGVTFDSAEEVSTFLTTVHGTLELQAAGVYCSDGSLFASIGEVLGVAIEAASGKEAGELKDVKRSGMSVHGRTGQPCPVCGDVIAEVSFADSSLQYCPTCQTGGKPLADRRMSKLLR